VKINSIVKPVLVGALLSTACATIDAASPKNAGDSTADPLVELNSSERRIMDSDAKALMNQKITQDPKSKTIEGTTGYAIHTVSGAPWYAVRQNGQLSDSDANLRNVYCSADALISVKSLKTKSHLSNDESFIVTKTKAKIVDMIKGPRGESTGAPVSIVTPGGVVKHGNDSLSIVNVENPDFTPGNEYLMAAKKRNADDGKSYWYTPITKLIRVSSGKIFPQGGEWFGFTKGTSYDEVIDKIKQVVKLSPCK
jgi:hypothetical protein